MLVHAVLAASIALQFAAAALALRLIAVTSRRVAWLLIAAALVLMAARRLITFFDALLGDGATPDLATELVALLISAAMLGGVAAIRPVFQDLRERQQRLQETMTELRRSNAEFQEFAHVVSHDLQEPLRMVISYLQLLDRRAGPRLDDSEREFLTYAVNGGKRMSTLIHDLLDYSRVGSQTQGFAPVATGDAVKEALANLRMAAAEVGAEITCGDLPVVLGDHAQLVRLFQNLIGNAVKYRAPQRAPRIHVAAERQAGRWLFSVRDNGIGIDPKDAERIFVIFQRLHGRDEYDGTGIGLAVARRIVERHGGRIWVESQPGDGSVFCFTLASAPETQVIAASQTVMGS